MKMNKLKLLIMITFIISLVFVIIMIKMIKENGECLDNPFTYSAQKLKDSGGNYYCYCQSLEQGLLDFSFNEEKITIKEEENYLYKFPIE